LTGEHVTHLLSLDWLTAPELDPVGLLDVAANLDVPSVQMRLAAPDWSPDTPPYDLIADAALRRTVIGHARARGVTVGMADPFKITPATRPEDFATALDTVAELGARGVNAVCIEPDLSRFLDRFEALAAQCAGRGLVVTLEPFAASPVNGFELAIDLVTRSGRTNAKLNVDSLHLFRTGGSVEMLRRIDPARIGYAQLCDGLLQDMPDAGEESLYDRMIPGTGAFPLADLIAALPPDLPIGIEVPTRRLAREGIGARERIKPIVAACRTLPGV
jgi:sugar phosphate isomerase/epimerase